MPSPFAIAFVLIAYVLFFLIVWPFFSLWLSFYLARKTSSWLCGIAAFCALFALMYGNAIYEHYRLKNLCKTAGIFIYKKVETNNLFYEKGLWSEGDYERDLKNKGFEYIEGRLRYVSGDSQQIYRFSLDGARNLLYVPIERPASQYVYHSWKNYGTRLEAYNIEYVTEIVDLESNQPIALHRKFILERDSIALGVLYLVFPTWSSYLDRFSRNMCGSGNGSDDIIYYAISPINNKKGNK